MSRYKDSQNCLLVTCSGVRILRIVHLPLVQVPWLSELSSCSGARIIRIVLFASCSGARIIRIVHLLLDQVPGLSELSVCLLFRCQGWKLSESERWWWWVRVWWGAGPEGAWCPRPDLPHGLPCLHSDALCRTCGKSENLWLSWVGVAVRSVSRWLFWNAWPANWHMSHWHDLFWNAWPANWHMSHWRTMM